MQPTSQTVDILYTAHYSNSWCSKSQSLVTIHLSLKLN